MRMLQGHSKQQKVLRGLSKKDAQILREPRNEDTPATKVNVLHVLREPKNKYAPGPLSRV